MNKTVLIVALILVAVGGLLLFTFSMNTAKTVPNTANDDTASTSQEVANYNAIVNAQNQQNTANQNPPTTAPLPNRVVLAEAVAGNFATAANVALTKPGYVVIYKINSNGDSSVLGHSDLLTAGTHSDVKIQLDNPVAFKESVVAVLHEDDGDEKFEYPDADMYLVNAGDLLVSDIDVVDVKSADAESKVLEAQTETYLKNNFKLGSTTN